MATTSKQERQMTDLEATRLCAVAMGYEDRSVGESIGGIIAFNGVHHLLWNPRHDDAQAMSLVKRLSLCIKPMGDQPLWEVRHQPRYADSYIDVLDADLNRAIVYCVAAMEQAKNSAK